METRANYILIGAFTLLAILGTLGFFIWLASVQINRQYASYGILFEDVSGLDPSGDVLFNGLSVGKVIGLQIYGKDPSKVLTTIEIDAEIPVRSDTIAQLQSQGVTGVAYVSLSGGSALAAALVGEDGQLPIIPSKRSTVQALVEDAPDLLAQATDLMQQLKDLTGPKNQALVSNILGNISDSSGRLDQALSDFSDITGTVRDATVQITQFTDRLDTIGAAVTVTLQNADTALASAQKAFDAGDKALTGSSAAIDSAQAAFRQAETLMRDQVPAILAQVSDAVAKTNAAIVDLQNRSGSTLDGFATSADLMNARLAELEKTLTEANTAFVAVTEASDSFSTLVDGDGTQMVAEARVVLADAKTAIASIDQVLSTDVPAIVTDIRTAVATASAAVDKVAADVTGLTGRFDPMAREAEQSLASARALFERATTTLDGVDKALVSAEGALGSAQTAFDSATGVMNTDLAPVLADIREASARISASVEDVTRDAPAIAKDLQALIARTDAVVAQVQTAIAQSAPGISDFAKKGLPELTQLGSEARNLVTTLNSLVKRIERDPARFLLDSRVPEYRR